jgi:lipopolysaccharide biosynthesis protein
MLRSTKEKIRDTVIKNKKAYTAISKTKRAIKSAHPKTISENRQFKKLYNNNAIYLRSKTRTASAYTAVIIHLYYTDSWQLLTKSLKSLNTPFDLFVTMPPQNEDFAEKIYKVFPNARVLIVPNRGRDVLPFLQIAQHLEAKGYKYVLKLHSKKSPHRKDGEQWFKELVQTLLPEKASTLDKLLGTLGDKNTGIIGPKGQYISLMVNFPPNGPRIAEALSRIYEPTLTDKIIRRRRQYGFFGGTMFWARLDALKPVLDSHFEISRFNPERGQIDATFAHALERIFSLVPEINKRDMYEIGPAHIKKLEYKTDNIPDWSTVYIGPKPVRKQQRKKGV